MNRWARRRSGNGFAGGMRFGVPGIVGTCESQDLGEKDEDGEVFEMVHSVF